MKPASSSRTLSGRASTACRDRDSWTFCNLKLESVKAALQIRAQETKSAMAYGLFYVYGGNWKDRARSETLNKLNKERRPVLRDSPGEVVLKLRVAPAGENVDTHFVLGAKHYMTRRMPILSTPLVNRAARRHKSPSTKSLPSNEPIIFPKYGTQFDFKIF